MIWVLTTTKKLWSCIFEAAVTMLVIIACTFVELQSKFFILSYTVHEISESVTAYSERV